MTRLFASLAGLTVLLMAVGVRTAVARAARRAPILNDPAAFPITLFPNRVIFLAAFDTGPKEPYWPGEFELAEAPPTNAFWRTARAVPRKDGPGKLVSLVIDPVRPVGARNNGLRGS